MRSLAAAALIALVGLAPAATRLCAQDFSITNPAAPPNGSRRDIMRQLQAWWDVHAYYPRRASQNSEAGTVRLRLQVRPDGNIWQIEVLDSAGSRALATAATAAFRGGFVRPLPPDAPNAGQDTDIDLALHFVMAYRQGQPVLAGYTPGSPLPPFTITNEPVKSPITDTMLQRTCVGTVVKQGIRNHPNYGTSYWARAIFFRKPDGTPWVTFYEGGFPILAPVTEVGKLVQWTGRPERGAGTSRFTQYTVWTDGSGNLSGNLESVYIGDENANRDINNSGTVDLACATETVPAITWSAFAVTPGQTPIGDPP